MQILNLTLDQGYIVDLGALVLHFLRVKVSTYYSIHKNQNSLANWGVCGLG